MVPLNQNNQCDEVQERRIQSHPVVKLSSVIDEALIVCDMKARTKLEAIEELSSLVAAKRRLSKEFIIESVLARERVCTTAIGRRSAFPHARLAGLKQIIVALGISKAGVDFDSLDGAPVNFIVLILTAETASSDYLGTLAAFAALSRDPQKMAMILSAESAADLLATIQNFGMTIES
jgi:PTS system nitrogen regulatory IIA component